MQKFSIHLAVRFLVGLLSLAAITAHAASAIVVAGHAVTFSATVDGTAPFTYKWYKDGTAITGATNSTYQISSMQTGNAGVYSAVISNSAGSTTSDNATITLATPPVITTQPVGQAVSAGASVTFTANASGSPGPAYQWQKAGVSISGATGATYVIASTVAGDAGTYAVVATNLAGSVTSNGAVLTVNPVNTAPTITAIANQTAVSGTAVGPVSFVVGDAQTAAGSLTVTGSSSNLALVPTGNIVFGGSGANRTVTVTPVTGQTGTDTITVKVSDGSLVTSASLTLTVNAPPPAISSPSAASGQVGAAFSYQITATNTPTSFRATGLPAGLTVNIATGLISGAPTAVGVSTITLGATNASGTGSATLTLTVSGGTSIIAINTGGSVVGSFVADTDFVNGTAYSSSSPVNTSGVSHAAPAAVYQTERWGSCTYTIPGLSSGTVYAVRLHFAEIYTCTTGQRLFNVIINGQTVLANFDIYATAGGANIAVVKDFNATANASGQIIVQFANGAANNAQINGLEILGGPSSPPPATSQTTATLSYQSTATISPTSTSVAKQITTTAMAPQTVTVSPLAAAASLDFNRDGKSDILWQNQVTGESSIWLMAGTSRTGIVSLGTNSTDWQIVATGDFNGDGYLDLLWQNHTTGESSIWLMAGTSVSSVVALNPEPTDWQIVATGDFNGDGKSDILWRHRVTGEAYIWLMNGTSSTNEVSLGTISFDWQVIGTGDFNRDGKSDILWQNHVTGESSIWLMAGTSRTGIVSLGTNPPDLQIVATGDFNGDGNLDLLWQNHMTGESSIWLMAGVTVDSSVSLGTVSLDWQLSGARDFNGDGQSDLLWQNLLTGEYAVWLMNGTAVSSKISLGTVSTDWVIRN